ncbi:hypothetical protein L1987_62189 [Smallanthus sonchifolius]|uniref:Uncharacterized protein n=1 Tax=Smallanthus sonchifolius TaxID=185202 RepID=A0ACB9C9R0_9ASTR|nr:hypothetical protein L1987_62189 [Smallanthus sonchifolius]
MVKKSNKINTHFHFDRLVAQQSENPSLQKGNIEEQEHVTVARALQKFRPDCTKTESLFASRPHKFPAVEAAPYVPVRHFRAHHGITPPVTIRNVIPVFSAPPRHPPQFRMPAVHAAPPPVTIRQAVPVFSAPEASKATIKAVTAKIPPVEEKVSVDPVVSLTDPMKLYAMSAPSLEEKEISVPVGSTGPTDGLQSLKEAESKVQDSGLVEKLKDLQV